MTVAVRALKINWIAAAHGLRMSLTVVVHALKTSWIVVAPVPKTS